MKLKALLSLLIGSFSLVHCMDFPTDNHAVTDIGLQKLINTLNKSSLTIVNLVKEHAQQNNVSLISKNLGTLFTLDQNKIDEIFLNSIEDDHLRPLMRSMGARINATTKENRNCLWYTMKPNLLTQLIDEGAEVNMVDTNGNSYLHNLFSFLECFDNNKKLAAARVLLARGANPNIDKSLLHAAVKCSNSDISIEATKLLCEYKVHTNIKNSLGNTPLFAAIQNKNTTVVELLLDHGAEVNSPNSSNEYPIHVAIPKNDSYGYNNRKKIIPAIVISLLDHGADPNQPYPDSGNMPLHITVHRNQYALAKQLVEHGALTDHIGQDNYTPLEIAQKYNYIDCIDLLIPYKPFNTTENKTDKQPDPEEVLTFSMSEFTESPQNNITPSYWQQLCAMIKK